MATSPTPLRFHVTIFCVPSASVAPLSLSFSEKKKTKGYNVSIFAYGQTGSGKSHSMMGSEKQPGLIRSVGDFLFDFLGRSIAHTSGFDVKGSVTVSCIEIYNEQIRVSFGPPVARFFDSSSLFYNAQIIVGGVGNDFMFESSASALGGLSLRPLSKA
jgi:hypothetical protein